MMAGATIVVWLTHFRLSMRYNSMESSRLSVTVAAKVHMISNAMYSSPLVRSVWMIRAWKP